MKYFLPLFLFIACTQRGKPLSEAKENELKKYFVSQYKQIDASSRVDSFALVKLDTITEQKKFVSIALSFMDEWEKQNQLMKLENQLLQKRIELMQISKGKEGAEQTKQEAKQSLDTIGAIEERIKDAQKKMAYYDSISKKADSVKPIGYEAICIYKIYRKNWTEQTDTAYIILDKNKDIVNRQTFYQE
jgi:hypothetical protein